jgi:glycosyltransferase involved in cell wall biosynthesis
VKIGIVTEFFPKSEKAEIRGGVEARAFNVAKQLSKEQEVVVLASRERGTSEKDEFLGIKVFRYGKEREYSQKGSLAERLSFIAEGEKTKEKFDIVDGYNFISYPIAWRISKRQGIPAIATYHDVWLGKWVKNIGPSGVLGEILERYVLSRKWEKFIAVSSYTRDRLVEVGVKKNQIEVIPSGVDHSFFKEIKAEKYREPTVCCIARLVDYKRVDDLIKALELVKSEIPDLECKIIGSGPEERKLKALVKGLNLQKNVEFLGFIKEYRQVIRILKSSHVFCLPSKVEGLGLAVVEAMAAGVPFVVSELPALVETTSRKGGFFFEPTKYKDLADKLLLVLKDKKIQRDLIKEGTRQAKKYDWEILVKKIAKVYNDVMAAKKV